MTYFIKNISEDLVIEPYFDVSLQPGETKEISAEAAQRLLVLRPNDVKVVDGIEPVKAAPVKPVSKEIAKASE